MDKQTITKDDGRYLIFYTFDDPDGAERSEREQPESSDDS